MAKTKSPKTKKIKKEIKKGRAYIQATFNNTIITITDYYGNVISWGSTGTTGFKGTRKSTPYAAATAAKKVAEKVKEQQGLEEIEVYVKGVGAGRESAIRALASCGLKVSKIIDLTPLPHNGPRAKKPRRV